MKEDTEKKGWFWCKGKLSRVKVGLVKSISGPPFTMETELEHSECTSLLGKNFQIVERGIWRIRRIDTRGQRERKEQRKKEGEKTGERDSQNEGLKGEVDKKDTMYGFWGGLKGKKRER